MSEIRIIKIENCKECPYKGRSMIHGLPFCWKAKEYLESGNCAPPSWCPLPKEEQNEEK